MAFTGTPTVKQVTSNKFRITGLSLGASAAGTIALTPGTGEAEFTAPDWQPHGDVTLQDAINAQVNFLGAGVATQVPVRIVKTGTTQADFVLTLTNNDGAAATPALEIYVTFD